MPRFYISRNGLRNQNLTEHLQRNSTSLYKEFRCASCWHSRLTRLSIFQKFTKGPSTPWTLTKLTIYVHTYINEYIYIERERDAQNNWSAYVTYIRIRPYIYIHICPYKQFCLPLAISQWQRSTYHASYRPTLRQAPLHSGACKACRVVADALAFGLPGAPCCFVAPSVPPGASWVPPGARLPRVWVTWPRV